MHPPTVAHTESCFVMLCRLSEIISELLLHIYGASLGNTAAEVHSRAAGRGKNLQLLWEELPAALKLDVTNLSSSSCPPGHILLLKSVLPLLSFCSRR